MPERIYLAVPYTHDDPAIRQFRFETVTRTAACLMAEGNIVYSPITMGHVVNMAGELPHDWNYWSENCLSYIEYWATHLCILTLPGWKESVGVNAELEAAQRIGLPVTLLPSEECHG